MDRKVLAVPPCLAPLQACARADSHKSLVEARSSRCLPCSFIFFFLLPCPSSWGISDASQRCPLHLLSLSSPPPVPNWWDWADQRPLFRGWSASSLGHMVLEQVGTARRSGREAGRASKTRKMFPKLMPLALPTFLLLEAAALDEPTRFSHQGALGVRGMAGPAAPPDLAPEDSLQKAQDGAKAPRFPPAGLSQAARIYFPFVCFLPG